MSNVELSRATMVKIRKCLTKVRLIVRVERISPESCEGRDDRLGVLHVEAPGARVRALSNPDPRLHAHHAEIYQLTRAFRPFPFILQCTVHDELDWQQVKTAHLSKVLVPDAIIPL